MDQKSWLYSDNFLKRAFAIWGYNMVASLIITIPLTVLWFIAMALMFSAMFHSLSTKQLQNFPGNQIPYQQQ